MKKNLITTLVMFTLAIGPVVTAMAQPNPNKQPSGDPVNGTPVGGNAPIGSGLILMVSMGVAYGIKRFTDKNTEV
ncbi:MAG: hypothetical protein V1775_05730 [Bacteroidota bacterium]